MNYKKDKILFWIETYHLHFGIAKTLAEKNDYDLYAIIVSSPQQKYFFENQKLVKFKKSWYLRENINLKNHKPNLEKLTFLENKFSIPLNKIIYGDRFFYKYNRYYSFTDDEILSIIEQELEFYDKVLDEICPDYVILRPPEFQDIELFYEICKSKKIPVLIVYATRLGNRWIISSEVDSPIHFDTSGNTLEIKSFDTLKKYSKTYSKIVDSYFKNHKSKISQKFNVLQLLFTTFNSSNITSYRDLGKTPWTTLSKRISLLLNSFYRKSFLDKYAQTSLPSNQKYAYFPLHFEPERVILRKAEFFNDQISVIKNITQSLPIEMDLLVKEHPSMQTVGWRNLEFYKQILKFPKVKLIHPSIPNEILIQNSSLIFTIAGTPGLDATFDEKPVIVFTNVNYSTLSSVFKINNLEELPEVIKKSLATKVDLVELNHFVNQVEKSSFECDLISLQILASNLFGIGGFLDGSPISESQMKKFLEEHKNIFEILAKEHIKKIEDIKKNNNV